METTTEKLQSLRHCMAEQSVDFYFTPSRDAHNNEYVPGYWQRRAWLTNFTGSYGEALIGQDQAYFWTDPRYALQAEQQLDQDAFQIMQQPQGMAAPISVWLSENAPAKATVGVDPQLIAINKWASFSVTMA